MTEKKRDTGKKESPEQAYPPNPVDRFLRQERMPHIWCSGCGIGVSVNCFVRALNKLDFPLDKVVIVSGIGCSGRIAGYLNFDSFHTTHGRAIPFAIGLKLANPELKVIVYSGDGDLVAIGGNHFIHAARRNVDLTVICINNFTYGMTGGQMAPTAPVGSMATTTPYGNLEEPFNLAHLADSSGANMVARWTTYHVVRLEKAMVEAMNKPGFSFVEVLAPCPTIYLRRNRLGDALAMMRIYKQKSVIRNNIVTQEATVDYDKGPIVVGNFVNRNRTPFLKRYHEVMTKELGDKFVPYSYCFTTLDEFDGESRTDETPWY
jgi:2-oxoglutarate ferredoxin oxidoreductase subunit beta